ncbi:PQQ-binding-like beta-propeller repeat protein [Nocardia sp. NPDC049737]|uniref:outer membrane protein assembly factor BamB family protein n=1 Tax=Nocardia sp. NPDC049737 TaxID=3154358 RepID=UPI003417688A
MNSDTTSTTNGSPKWLARLTAAAGAMGFGLIASGTILGLYSRFFAAKVELDDRMVDGEDFFGSFRLPIDGVPDRFATAAVILGALMLFVSAGVVVRGLRAREGSGRAIVLALAALLAATMAVVLPVKSHLPGIYGRIRFEYPFFDQLPTAVAASGLVLAGTVLVLGLTLRPANVQRLRRRTSVGLASLGLVVGAAVTGAAVRAGDDNANIDHNTIAAVEVPALPQRLGSERYRVPIPMAAVDRYPDNGYDRRAPDTVVAGTGFVVASTEGLTAYDGATGVPRWHYLRTNAQRGEQLGVEYIHGSLRSVDGGTVVLARWDNKGWIAFDAVTGQVLWSDSAFARNAPDPNTHVVSTSEMNPWSLPRALDFRPAPQFLTLANRTHVVRYDGRTGTPMWSAEGCSDPNQNILITDTAIYRIARCKSDNETRLTATALDPKTGAVTSTRELARAPAKTDITVLTHTLANTIVVDWSSFPHGSGTIIVDRPDRLANVPILPGNTPEPIAADPNGPEVLTEYPTQPYDSGALQVMALNENTVRYQLPGLSSRYPATRANDLFLASELVEATLYEGADGQYRAEIHSWNRTDGTPAMVYSLDRDNNRCEGSAPLAVPGAVVVVCYASTRVEVIGFATS